MAWNDTKVGGEGNSKVLAADWNVMTTIIDSKSTRTTGAGTPTTTSSIPSAIGDIYIDTTNNKIYLATGTSSPTDYKKVLSE